MSEQSFTTFLIAACSVDGFIGRSSSDISTSWTSKEDATFFREKTTQVGAVVFGRTTYETFNRPLPGRLNLIYSRSATEIQWPAYADLTAENNLVTTSLEPDEIVNRLKQLRYPGFAIGGGSSVYSHFLQAGVIEDFFVTIEPKVFGKGIPLFAQEHQINLKLLDVISLSDQTKVLHYANA